MAWHFYNTLRPQLSRARRAYRLVVDIDCRVLHNLGVVRVRFRALQYSRVPGRSKHWPGGRTCRAPCKNSQHDLDEICGLPVVSTAATHSLGGNRPSMNLAQYGRERRNDRRQNSVKCADFDGFVTG